MNITACIKDFIARLPAVKQTSESTSNSSNSRFKNYHDFQSNTTGAVKKVKTDFDNKLQSCTPQLTKFQYYSQLNSKGKSIAGSDYYIENDFRISTNFDESIDLTDDIDDHGNSDNNIYSWKCLNCTYHHSLPSYQHYLNCYMCGMSRYNESEKENDDITPICKTTCGKLTLSNVSKDKHLRRSEPPATTELKLTNSKSNGINEIESKTSVSITRWLIKKKA